MTSYAVIGAGYGDEGKGLMTDFLAARASSSGIVIRANGGAQAGHTVVTPAGVRHVFHHFGSGTFAGWPTFLSSFFVSNPLLLTRELDDLHRIGVRPTLIADPNGLVTTPYDMLLNQFAEQHRGAARHGSCGVGFGETLERCERSPAYRITIADLSHPSSLRETLHSIRELYVPTRVRELGLNLTAEQSALAADEALVENFLPACADFLRSVQVQAVGALPKGLPFLFEGAQGLELDQDLGTFPHVTRSHTGLRNVLRLAEVLQIHDLHTVYATRCYKTRHGAGPMPHALAGKPWPTVEDATNVPHDYQGSIRFGWLDLDRVASLIDDDSAEVGSKPVHLHRHLAVTCLDQVLWPLPYVQTGQLQFAPVEKSFLQRLQAHLRPASLFIGRGASRMDVASI